MAIYHLSAQVISRSQGRSSVAAAAYRGAECLHDERLGKTYDFTKKNDVLAKEVLLPNGAPAKLKDRATLWNAVEAKENRKDAQVAREINIALPRELNNEQNWKLAKAFVQREFVAKGMIADVTFHSGHVGARSKEEELNADQPTKQEAQTQPDLQPHIHVMLTMREVTEEGFGQKVREWNSKEMLQSWREHWAEHCNLELARHGFDVKIDHRSLDAQQINLEPQTKIGPKVAYPEMVRLVEHQELAYRNGERIRANPEIALQAITRQRSTFTHQDLARFINRHTIDAEQFNQVYELVKASPEIVYLGKDDRNHDRYTTREMLALEKGMLEKACELHNSNDHFVKELGSRKENLSKEQQEALLHIVQSKDIACVIGYAGTGKTYLLSKAKEAWEKEGFNVLGVTLSGIAAENLEAGSGIKSYTVASRLWHWERGREFLTSKDVMVVDEAGMLGSRQMDALLQEAKRAKAKIVPIGDVGQLQAIEAGAPFRAIAQELSHASLTEIRRQQERWQKEATKDFAQNNTKEGLLAYERHDNVHKFITKAEAVKSMAEQWDEVRSQSSEKSQIMLAYTKAEVKHLNEYARSLYRDHEELGKDFGVKTSRGIRDFAVGDRVYFLRNENHNLHVKNGTLGTIAELDGRDFTVKLDQTNSKGETEVKFNIQDYRDIEHGYAATIHKAQGITVDRAYVLASKYFDKHTTYVAMSRHREGADLYYAQEEFSSFNGLAKTLSRERAKDVTLDYTQARNLETLETKILQNNIEQNPQYNMVLTDDRAQQAEQRLIWRSEHSVTCQTFNELAQTTGLQLNTKFKDGDQGMLIGRAEINGVKYGVVEQEQGRGFLIADSQLGANHIGREIVIENYKDKRDHESLRGINPELQQRHDREMQKLEQTQQTEIVKQQKEQEKTQQRDLQHELDRGGFER